MSTEFELIVTRYEPLAQALRELGLAPEDAPRRDRTRRRDVEGRHVIGYLPLHLAAEAASVADIPFDWSADARERLSRGETMGVEETKAAVQRPCRYVVTRLRGRVDRPCWLAVARAYEHVETLGRCGNGGPIAMATDERVRSPSGRALSYDVTVVTDWSEGEACVEAYVCEQLGIWRRGATGEWMDGYGRPVDLDEVADEDGQ